MNYFIGIIVIYISCVGICSSAPEIFTCSRSCNRRALQNKSQSKREAREFPEKYPCSCSSSCTQFGDCCADSKYRKHEETPDILPICLPLYGYDHFMAINQCPKTWDHPTDFCENGLGNLPPVTSRKTGATYSNIYCAICNNDADKIVSWDSKIECCSFVDLSDEDKEGRYIQINNSLWRVFKDENKSLKFCQCTIKLNRDPKAFLEQVRVRGCEERGTDTCHLTWMEKETEDACKSYLDPVFIGEKLYRNKHCATCNYEQMDGRNFLCIPPAMNHLLGRSWSRADSYNYCKQHNLSACLDYLNNSRGRPRPFYENFLISTTHSNQPSSQCIPPAGERCCKGYRFDFRKKRCRQVGV